MFAISANAFFTNTDDAHWWNEPYPKPFDGTQLKKQSFISVKGNQFFDDKGKTFIFRGFNIGDPDKLVKQNQWSKRIFQEISDWGGNTIP